MKSAVALHTTPEALSDECLDLILDEAERALLRVEARADDPGGRVIHGDVPDEDAQNDAVDHLRLAIAELVDAHPSIPYDLEFISERTRNVGSRTGTAELESHPHVMDLVRLSLEVFFRQFPELESYAATRYSIGVSSDDDSYAPGDVYLSYERLLGTLRRYLS